jgi:hypothetical protein
MNLASATTLALAALQHLQPHAGYQTSGVHHTLQSSWIGVHDRWIVTLIEPTPSVIRLSMRDTLERRAQQLTADVRTEAELRGTIEAWFDRIEWWRTRLSINRLQPQHRYRVIQPFRDYYGGTFEAGAILTYVEQHSVPYHGGTTIVFKETKMYLQDEENGRLIADFDAYVEETL